MSNFKIGQKVVCVDDSNQTVISGVMVKKDSEYIVSGFFNPYFKDAIYLEGINNSDGGYWPWRFRALEKSFAEELLAEISEWHKSEEAIKEEILEREYLDR